ncbi:MAG: Rieske 2Fe-2S domain-containing protein [Paracoccaceae bacterium]
MTETDLPKSEPMQDNPQELVGFMSNDEWQNLLSDVNGLIQEMEELAFPQVKERVFLLLAGIDTIHREALRRLVRLFKEDVMEQVVTDPAIHTLMELYDMLPPNVERAEPSEFNFEFGGGGAKPADSPQRGPVSFPHWVPALSVADNLAEGKTLECHVDGRILLLVRMEGKFYAFDSACVTNGASLKTASLSKYTLTCPHHSGCHYDIRHGGQIGGTKRIECYNVNQDEKDRVMVGIDMDFKPNLPAF